MLFNSFQFLIFFPVVTILFFLVPHRWRWLHLLVASCIFYAAFIPIYILVLFLTIIIDYIAGILIENSTGPKRKRLLILSIISNVGVLAVFKYYNFFIGNVNELLHLLNFQIHSFPLLNLILPIGLSFHTFQAMSYTIEVYRGNQKAERHFGIYALYVMFYPQLVAGPIERPQNMLHQFHEKKFFKYTNFIEGMKMILWGLFMKVVIADRLSLFVNEIYNNPNNYEGLTFVAATIFFSFQIYCDFAGYSLIAIGSARVMGFDLMQNFNMPYLAISIREFWQRWHISLSTWFRDYVYIPLGGNREGKWRWYYNIFITFIISGIWHGANWTYVIWGAMHGLFIGLEHMLKNVSRSLLIILNPRIRSFILNLIVFGVVCLAWVFFRADSLRTAIYILNEMLDINSYNLNQLSLQLVPESNHSVYTIDIFLGWFWIIFLLIAERYFRNIQFDSLPTPVRWSAYLSAIVLLLVLGVYENNQFIYFQF